jgi:hypothetical protein
MWLGVVGGIIIATAALADKSIDAASAQPPGAVPTTRPPAGVAANTTAGRSRSGGMIGNARL